MMMFFLEKNMKKWKIGISVMLELCIFMLTACGSKKSVDNKSTQNAGDCITVSIPESFESLSGMNADNLMDYLKTNGDGNYEELKIADGLVKISVTEEQANYWKNYAKDKVDAQLSTLTNVSSKYSASCSDSFDVINVYYDTIISFKEAFAYVGKTAIYCALYQLFNGQKDYTITLDVYNVDTGKLVAGGNLEKDDVSYGDTEWKASYILDDKEAGELESKYEDEGEVIDIKSSFIDGMSVINILQAAAGNDYQYIYIDSDGTVQLKVTESQKNTLIENMNQYLSSVSEQFKNLGDGYDISWNTDFSEISYKFDSALSKQDQSNYFTYTETIGMLNQLLKGDSNSYYIDLSIYNSSSGELVSKGNTKDGITWNIGE